MRRLLPAALIFLAIGPVPGTHQRFPEIDLTERVVAHPLHFRASGNGTLRFVRGWHLTSPHSHFGGFSGIARIGPDRFQLVGDNGYWTRLTLTPDGRVRDLAIASLPTPEGRPRRKSMIDAEAMIVDPESGKTWISFEVINQVWRFDAALTQVESRYSSPALRRWPVTAGPEAMVRLPSGQTILFSENADDDPRGTEALLYDKDPAAPGSAPVLFYYDAGGKGLVSDAAVLPDGRILLVHRRLGFDPVFTTILGLVDPADIGAGKVVRSRTIGRVPKPLADNYEGAAVSVEGGRTFLWLVSDDNFNLWQRSLLLQFELVDLPPRKTPDSKKAAR
ncbi:esterase-like activity of phytase family protein [Sphingopyxis sp. J-6]|uniref:esterase-like activity of phytase family protein n=1 Tax=Sphingopyxis sp. J-6 TaxID=3122054 RepID=UPI003983E359